MHVRSVVGLSGVVLVATQALSACGGASPSAMASTLSTAPARAAVGTTAVLDTQAPRPKGPTIGGAVVDRVVDGDTLHVLVDGADVDVRLIGINTPETVKPGSPVECFGPQASEFAKKSLTGRTVTLEFDESQGRTDQYDRTLAYVWIEKPGGGLSLFNLRAVAGGYAYERQYGPTPYAWKSAFRSAQKSAQQARAGLWGAC